MKSKYTFSVFNNLQKYYKRIINSNNKLPLGRWDLIYDHRMQKRIDRANEDHCGPCGSTYIQNASVDENVNDVKDLGNTKRRIGCIEETLK
jgi:hypothetical protein